MPLLPQVAFLRVRVGPPARLGCSDLLYSLVHNDAHTNVAFMFGEDKRRLPEDDTLSVVRGHFGSYPNFIFEVEAGRDRRIRRRPAGASHRRRSRALRRQLRHPPHQRALLGDRRLAARRSEAPRAHDRRALRLRPLQEPVSARDLAAAAARAGTSPAAGAIAFAQARHPLLPAQADVDLRPHVAHPDAAPAGGVDQPERERALRRGVVRRRTRCGSARSYESL